MRAMKRPDVLRACRKVEPRWREQQPTPTFTVFDLLTYYTDATGAESAKQNAQVIIRVGHVAWEATAANISRSRGKY
jgi:hypothetical protein